MTLQILYKLSICQLGTSHSWHSHFKEIINMGNSKPLLFHSLTNILNILEKPENRLVEGVQELLEIYQRNTEQAQNNLAKPRKYPFIVLEGLDGCGKTSMELRLATSIGAQRFKTPPDSIAHIRDLFDEHIELRTAYYSLGNYIAALEVQNSLNTAPAVMDRFWHSTAAYAIAQAVEDHPDQFKMPPPHDEIFTWPEDLLQPDIVIFLDVSEEVRKQRQSRRTNVTMQENLLNNSEKFRKCVIQAYKSMHKPGVVFVNSNFTFQRTLAEIENHTKHLLNK